MADIVMNSDVKLGVNAGMLLFFSLISALSLKCPRRWTGGLCRFLNSYMSRMVGCVHRTRGIVDKYIGDAIMAIWGVPVSTGDDAFNAVNAALMMREKLIELNKSRGTVKRPFIGLEWNSLRPCSCGSDWI
jgi:adenylate cyclase